MRPSVTHSRSDLPQPHFEPGTRIGSYELVQALGAGGMAEVFLARRASDGGDVDHVAVKRLPLAHLDDARFRRRLRSEAELISRLKHANIAQFYDFKLVGGAPFLFMEYVNGVPLRRLIDLAREKGQPLSEGFACYVTAKLADALDYAHALTDEEGRPLGIVHRDVSADNVMVDALGAVKLIDFGIAQVCPSGRLGTAGGFQGKYCYASPEQVAGEVLDGRSDLFSLGLVLMELATGRRVFDTGNAFTTFERILEADVAVIAAATRGLSEGLRRVIAKALARERGARFQTGAELREALEGCLETLPHYEAVHAAEELERLLNVLPELRAPDAVSPPEEVATSALESGRRWWWIPIVLAILAVWLLA